MNEIVLLSQDTIDKIAAGEVVERPSSVVKELVENAIDAGANAVTVEIKDGGTSLVRITDNGCGIPKEQVRIAYQQHATSKIRTVDDLLTSGTLGFRGEALSSIAAVSQVEMITKTAGSLTGVRYVIEGGAEKSLEEIGAPEGTTFLVHNLFYNTPARKKFLKSPSGEAGCVSDLMERMALSHPEISFKFINNRDTKIHTSGNCNLKDIIYSIYGRDIASNLLKIDSDFGNIKITGFIGKPVISRGNRNYENYFVNNRYVKSTIIARGIEDAYKPFMMSHRYPFTVLRISIDTEEVDVNVHPQKLEVRFSNQQDVYEKVYQSIKDALLGKELIPEFTIDTPAGSSAPKGSEASKAAAGLTAAPNGMTYSAGRSAESRDNRKSGASGSLNGSQSAAVGTQIDRNGSKSGVSGSQEAQAVRKSPARYPEPFEKIRSQLIAEAASPYERKYPNRDRQAVQMKPVTGTILPSDGKKEEKRNANLTEKQNETPNGKLFEPLLEKQSDNSNGDPNEKQTERLIGNPTEKQTGGQNEKQNEGQDEKQIGTGLPGVGKKLEALDEKQEKVLSEALKEDTERMQEELQERQAVQMELFDEKLLSEANRPKHRLIGQVFDTYWIVEFDEKMYLIDQHAAHEKVLYERFMKEYREKKQTSQMITPPVIVTISLQEEPLLKRHMEAFTSVGFEIEPFGGREYAISAVPGNLYGLASKELFLEILDGLSDVSEKASDQMICEKIASMSCKAAVKGNSRFTAAEANALINELLTLENPYNCPHGRPTIVTMTKYELEKKFKRVL